jgi:hypothetical protein
MQQSDFIRMVRNDLAERDCILVFGRGKQINCNGFRVDGYFSEHEKEIRVARASTQWLGVLAHEYAHYRQWVEGDPTYLQADDAIDMIDNWFAGKEYAERDLTRAFRIVRKMERDAERRSVDLIKYYQLPVNLDLYIRRANCYIYSHFIMHLTRKFWAFKRDPFRSRTILSMMPSDFRTQTHAAIPPHIEEALVKLV